MQKQEKLDLINEKVKICTRCDVLCETRNQTVFGVGNPNTRIVLLGEAPGKDEDLQGEPFVGRSGRLLNDILKECGIKREDVYILNILKCRPPNNRTPTQRESDNCKVFLDLQLQVIRPDFILCLGSCAAQNLLETEQAISTLRKQIFKYPGENAIKVVCTYHPSYALRNPSAKVEIWNDIKFLLENLDSQAEI